MQYRLLSKPGSCSKKMAVPLKRSEATPTSRTSKVKLPRYSRTCQMAESSMWMKDHRTPQVRPTNLLMPLILISLQQWISYGYELMQKTAAFWQDAINPGTLY